MKSGAYYDYDIGQHGDFYGSGAQDYSTDVLGTRAVNFIWSTPKQRSLFLYFAPHDPYSPSPRDIGSLKGKLPPLSPCLDRRFG